MLTPNVAFFKILARRVKKLKVTWMVNVRWDPYLLMNVLSPSVKDTCVAVEALESGVGQ